MPNKEDKLPPDELPPDESPDELPPDESSNALPLDWFVESLPQFSPTEPMSDYTPPGSQPGSTPSTPSTPPPRTKRAFTGEGESVDLMALGTMHGVYLPTRTMCEIEDTPPPGTGASRTCTEQSATEYDPATGFVAPLLP